MKKQSTAIWASMLLVLTALVLGSLVQYAFYGRDGDQIVLPGSDVVDQTPVDQIAVQNKELLETLSVDASNISVLLRQLVRPEMYHWESRVTLHSGSITGQSMVSADRDGSLLRVTVRRGAAAVEEYILTDLRFYAWESGDNLVYSGKREDFTEHEIMMSVAYESLLELPPEAMLSAGVTKVGERDCLAVTAADPVTGYLLDYRISVDDGLLLSLTAQSDGEPVYAVERLILEQGVVRSGAFTLPDGTVPETAQR